MKEPRRTQETVLSRWSGAAALPYDAPPGSAPEGESQDAERRRRTGARGGPPDLVAVPVLLVRDTQAIYRAFQRFTRDVRKHARVRVSDACIGRAAVRVMLQNQQEILRAIAVSRFGDREAREDDFVRVLQIAFGLRPPPAPQSVDELTDGSRLQYPHGPISQGGGDEGGR